MAGGGRVRTKSRWKLSPTSRGSVLSKQLKQNVARKKTMTSKPTLGCAECVRPLVKVGPGGDVVGVGLVAFGTERRSARRKFPAQSAAATQPGPVSPRCFRLTPPDNRPENEAEPEGHADETHSLRAVVGRGDVGDVGLGDGDVAAAHAGEHAREDHQP